jgi:hypothetical protein
LTIESEIEIHKDQPYLMANTPISAIWTGPKMHISPLKIKTQRDII